MMGFFSGLKKFFMGEENTDSSKLDTEFIENIQVNDIPIQIAKMRQRIVTVEQIYPEQAAEIVALLNKFEQKLQDIDMTDIQAQVNLDMEFTEIKERFKAFYKVSREKFALNEAKNLTKRLEDILFGKESTKDIAKTMESEEKYLNSLKARISSFDGVKQQAYIAELIKAGYRLKCLNVLDDYISKAISSIIKSSKAEKIIYATILMEDMKRFDEQLSYISTCYKLNGLEFEVEKLIQEELDELNEEMTARYIGNLSLESFFDDEKLLQKYLNTIKSLSFYQVNLEDDIKERKERIERIELQKQEEKRKKEEEKAEKEREEQEKKERYEKYKTIDQKEIKKEIKRIDDETADITTSYVNILKYEMEVGEAKGIINKKNMMKRDDLVFSRVKRGDVLYVLKNAEKLKNRCFILIDADDYKNGNCLVVYSNKINSKKLLKKIQCRKTYTCNDSMPALFDVSSSFIYVLEKNIEENNYLLFCDTRGKLCYNDYYSRRKAEEEVKSWIDSFKEIETKPEAIRDIPFYIEISYLRPMLPILEQLSSNGIEFYLPPIDENTNKYDAKKKIYIDRQYLQKYKELVHKNISSVDKGIVTIGLENITIPELILDDCDFSSLYQEQEQ